MKKIIFALIALMPFIAFSQSTALRAAFIAPSVYQEPWTWSSDMRYDSIKVLLLKVDITLSLAYYEKAWAVRDVIYTGQVTPKDAFYKIEVIRILKENKAAEADDYLAVFKREW